MICCSTVFYVVFIAKSVSLSTSSNTGHRNDKVDEPIYAKTEQDNSKILNNSVEEKDISSRVVGGRGCSVEEYPWMVSIRTTSRLNHYCGGSLISFRWVLSAAHCFEKYDYYRKPWRVTVVVGLSSLRRQRSQAIKAKKIFIHDGYETTGFFINDIALVVLTHNVRVHLSVIGFIKIPVVPLTSDLSKICPSESFMVAGWGSQTAYGLGEPQPPYKSSSSLRCADIPVITNQECQKFSKAAYNDKIVCAVYKPGGRDSCQGDSGGPFFCRGVQYGIISWGYGCASPNTPAFYTRVDRYLDFINETMTNYRDCSSTFGIDSLLFIISIFGVIFRI